VRVINVAECQPDDVVSRGEFHVRRFDLTERLGASVIGATVYDMRSGEKLWPYHFHHGVEEWLYVVSGAPVLRDPRGERVLAPAELVAFASGPAGGHGLRGPGRVVMFSAGARGFGEAYVTVYPDSDKIAAAPGVIFRRADGTKTPPGGGKPPSSGGQTWTANVHELAPGEVTAGYHYEWCREAWALVVAGTPVLRHADGEVLLSAGDICCFPQGPSGARQLRNDTDEPARVMMFSTATDRPMSAFYPDESAVIIQAGEGERWLFRYEDRIEDYWDGEPGAS
jgi:uncharacterized cupin superfamily protein